MNAREFAKTNSRAFSSIPLKFNLFKRPSEFVHFSKVCDISLVPAVQTFLQGPVFLPTEGCSRCTSVELHEKKYLFRRNSMNKFLKLATVTLVALSIWACVDNANKPANSNANISNANANAAASKAPPSKD